MILIISKHDMMSIYIRLDLVLFKRVKYIIFKNIFI
jgi:hypothetical protein